MTVSKSSDENTLSTDFGGDIRIQGLGLKALRGAIDAHAIVVVTDAKGVITHVNEKFCEISQYSREELVGQTPRMVNSGYHPAAFWRSLWKRIRSGKVWNGQICNRDRHGSDYWVQATIYPSIDETGEIEQFVAILTDITLQKNVENQIRSSRQQLQEAVRVARIGSWECDLTSRVLTWSWMTKLIHEVEHDFEPSFENALSFYEEGWSRERMAAVAEGVIASGGSWDEELVIVTGSGRRKWVRSIGYAEHDNGKCVRLYGVCQDIDDDKRLRIEGERNANLLRTIFNAATEFSIIATDTDGMITVFNRGAERLLGYSEAEMIGRSAPEALHAPEEVEQRSRELSSELGRPVAGFEVLATLASSKGFERREWTYVRKDGSRFPVSLVVTPMLDGRGELTGYLGMARDISRRKEAERSLIESEQRWQFALEGSGDGVWDWNVETGEVFYSRRWKEMLGFAEDEIGTTFSEWECRVHPEDIERCYADLQKHFRGEAEYYSNEHRMLCKDGFYKWILVRGKVIARAGTGEPARVIGTHTDITDRRKYQDRLAESEDRFRGAFLNSCIGMAIVALDGSWKEVNRSLLDILGYEVRDLLSLTSQEITHPDDLPKDLEMLEEMLRGKRDNYAVEKRYIHAEGHPIWANSLFRWCGISMAGRFISYRRLWM